MTDTCPSPGRRQDEPLLCVKARDLNHPRKEIKHSCLCKCFTSSFKKEEQGGFDCAGRFLCAYGCPRQWERCEAKNLPCPSFQRGVTDFTVRSVVRSGVVHIRRVQTKLMSNDQLPKRGFRRRKRDQVKSLLSIKPITRTLARLGTRKARAILESIIRKQP